MHILDDQDKILLRLLQQNNRLTAEELAGKVNLSQSAIQRRLANLRKHKIIEADISIVSHKAVGLGITCIVDVTLYEGNSKGIDDFKKSMLKCAEVSQCYYVTGSYDFVLIVNVRDMNHFEEFQKRKLLDNANVKHFYTHVVMDKVKFQYAIEI